MILYAVVDDRSTPRSKTPSTPHKPIDAGTTMISGYPYHALKK